MQKSINRTDNNSRNRKTGAHKKKNIFELINSVEKSFFDEDEEMDYISYCQVLINIARKLHIEEYDLLNYTQTNTEEFFKMIHDLEEIVVKSEGYLDRNVLWRHNNGDYIFGFAMDPNYFAAFYLEGIFKIKNKSLQIAVAHMIKQISLVSNRYYNAETSWDNPIDECFEYITHEAEQAREEIDQATEALIAEDLNPEDYEETTLYYQSSVDCYNAVCQKRAHYDRIFMRYDKLLQKKFPNLQRVKPIDKKDIELKELLVQLVPLSFNVLDNTMISSEVYNHGQVTTQDMINIFPAEDEFMTEECELFDRFNSEGVGCTHYTIPVSTKENELLDLNTLRQNILDFENRINLIEKIRKNIDGRANTTKNK